MEQSLPIQVTAVECYETRELYTPDYLLLLPLRGGALLRGTADLRIEEGALVFLAPLSGHKLYLEQNSSVLYAVISAQVLDEVVRVPKRITHILLRDNGDAAKEKLIQYFDLCHNDQGISQFQRLAACYDLLSTLEPAISSIPEESEPARPRSSRIAAYLEAHFREPIQLPDVAEAFGLTPQHLSSTIHKELGMPFTACLQRLRLEEAVRLLLSTDKNITVISEESGFPNLRSFNLAFQKQYGCGPREYRREKAVDPASLFEKPEDHVLQHVNQLLQPYRMVYSKSDEAATVSNVLDAGPGTPDPAIWQDILNVDVSADCLQSSVQASISAIQSELHFRYVRLSNFFTHEMMPYIASQNQHRFTGFFRVVDFFRRIGLTPMLALGDSYEIMLDAIMSRSPYTVAEQDWLRQLAALLDAAISYWGRRWVAQWRFEFYMPETLYGKQGSGAFLSLFEKSVALIKDRLPAAEVGGPAIPVDSAHISRWKDWFQGVRERDIPVDFVSVMLWADYSIKTTSFSGQFGELEESRTLDRVTNADMSLPVQKVRQIRSMMEDCGLDAKLYVSALGITQYQAAAAQIGGRCGAYLVKSVMGLRGLVDGIGCWKAVNSEVEYPDEFSIYGSGCGLLSRYDLKNPSWYAYAFLSKLLPNLLLQGIHCLVTTDGAGRYAVLVHNCKNYSDYFLRHYTAEKGLRFSDGRLYQNTAALRQTLTIRGVGPGSYEIRQYLAGNHHGCIAAVLHQMGTVKHPTQQEIEYIAGQSMPFQHTYLMQTEKDLQLTVTLQHNEIMLLRITPEGMESD